MPKGDSGSRRLPHIGDTQPQQCMLLFPGGGNNWPMTPFATSMLEKEITGVGLLCRYAGVAGRWQICWVLVRSATTRCCVCPAPWWWSRVMSPSSHHRHTQAALAQPEAARIAASRCCQQVALMNWHHPACSCVILRGEQLCEAAEGVTTNGATLNMFSLVCLHVLGIVALSCLTVSVSRMVCLTLELACERRVMSGTVL